MQKNQVDAKETNIDFGVNFLKALPLWRSSLDENRAVPQRRKRLLNNWEKVGVPTVPVDNLADQSREDVGWFMT